MALTFRLVVEGMRALHQIITIHISHCTLQQTRATKGGIGTAAPIATKKDATAPSKGASSSMQMQKLRNIDIISWQLYVSRERARFEGKQKAQCYAPAFISGSGARNNRIAAIKLKTNNTKLNQTML